MAMALEQQIEKLSAAAPGKTATSRRREAIGSWSAMVGAMILARMSNDPGLSD